MSHSTEGTDKGRAEFLQGLRDIADFLESHPELPLPYLGTGSERTGTPHVLTDYIIGDEPREQLAQITRALASMGGTVHKYADDNDRYSRFLVWRAFGPIALAYQADRSEVCERVVVGTERVEVEVDACPECGGPLASDGDGLAVCADDSSHYQARKPGKRVESTEREIVEWRCSPLLGGESA